MSIRFMCVRYETDFGCGHMMLNICCDEIATRYSDTGKEEGVKCMAKTVKPECPDCSLINPNSHPKYTPHLNTPRN